MESYICMEEVVANYKNVVFIPSIIVLTIQTTQQEKLQSERKQLMATSITFMKME